jgi:DNA repair protein RadC
MIKRIQVNTSLIAYNIAKDVFKDLDHEELWVLYLNRGNEPISFERMTSGGWTSTVIDLRQIFSTGLRYHSTGMILFHNHLSGSCNPSTSDITNTKNVNKISKILEIQLIDHIIISGNSFYSFADEEVTTIE